MKDMVLIMSDQHGWDYTGFTDERIDTPGLKKIAEEGLLFERCYCNSPLCVPSRMSFLTGKLPSQLGIFNNDAALGGDVPTIAHEMGRMGYQTVLAGRMHFKGEDQKHGFDQRYCGDITSQFWGTGGKNRLDFGVYAGTTNRKNCLDAVGGGISPVMVYDEMVFQSAMDFLEDWRKKKENRKPLFLVIGFYGPHFPFTCKNEDYKKYQSRFSVKECEKEARIPSLSIYKELLQECAPEHVRNSKAAYCGLVEQLDRYVGELYNKIQSVEAGREYLFLYTSDHGEQLGKRKLFGKQTMYEAAVHIPLLAAGTGISSGISRRPVGLLDVSRTLLEETGRKEDYSWHQGKRLDFSGSQDENSGFVRIQQMLGSDDSLLLTEAVVLGQYKIVKLGNETICLYDLQEDPHEEHDLSMTREGLLKKLMKQIEENGGFLSENELKYLSEQEREARDGQRRLKAWGQAKKPEEWATMKIDKNTLINPRE
ncbi:sulfatase-like hydrolase/transferase [Lacrimispora brassicae]